MPLDTGTYGLALLRVDGRLWNNLRRLNAQIQTQAAADGSSYLEMGNTKVMCVVTGPSEDGRRKGGAAQTASGPAGGAGAGGAEEGRREEIPAGGTGAGGFAPGEERPPGGDAAPDHRPGRHGARRHVRRHDRPGERLVLRVRRVAGNAGAFSSPWKGNPGGGGWGAAD